MAATRSKLSRQTRPQFSPPTINRIKVVRFRTFIFRCPSDVVHSSFLDELSVARGQHDDVNDAKTYRNLDCVAPPQNAPR
jgi:hypothetical protein